MTFTRSSGILLHPTSLPSQFGIGDLGPQAYRWVDFLARSGTRLWQLLPLGPTGYADSPYQAFSAMAGNPYLISPKLLVEDGLLDQSALDHRPAFSEDQVEYGQVIPWKMDLLEQAYDNFQKSKLLKTEFAEYQRHSDEWLPDFSLFMALKQAHNLEPWHAWPAPLRDREAVALDEVKAKYQQEINQQACYQFLFHRQWQALRKYANGKGIQIIGDIPIYVAHDSADVWANRELFQLNNDGRASVVAGVPPDYFSSTGQLWGNPIYRWEQHAENGFSWWRQRIRKVLGRVDIIRLDHFRGFAGYWEVPGGNPTAKHGQWLPGPGAAIFEALLEEFGELPLIAEDLGHITPDVTKLREQFNLPGMKIMQFGFEADRDHPFIPDNYEEHSAAYTGTHDNATIVGWYQQASDHQKWFSKDYLQLPEDVEMPVFAKAVIKRLWDSAAVFSLAPLQDFLALGNQARMNYPGTTDGNWRWRAHPEAFTDDLLNQLHALNLATNRISLNT
ncbi:MAG: 4-alpha-glucanotransferase [Chloroflexota bacterium]